ncbi:beta-galactosidase [Bifidobacterium sp. ESL0732]|uniref:beta-galactosidase n=1 Tax=Bifidobacterium sp. ESL0732 TaxID=2983222 RepID=UPI0023F81A5A|nr:beta-galactosidase [Bifidobacterium sp. ESL0732]WEV64007.1 beta-galactosidase [Bifidobacterium sp. ESL0732]
MKMTTGATGTTGTSAVFDRFYYGGDWNPEQWDEDTWHKDIAMLEDAGINEATINVFSWAQLQPDENTYDFSTLDKIVQLLVNHHFGIVMATSTAAIPSWMAKRHPDVMRTDFEGRHHVFGDRHNPCPNSPTFKEYAPKLAGKLAERYADTPGLVAWHVSNEYGEYCYCDTCAKLWRQWLKAKYGTTENLNKAWNGHFWQHMFYDWDDIVVPNALGPEIAPGITALSKMSMDYRRFMSQSITRCFTDEKQAIRQFDKTTPITTNMMGLFMDIDYFEMGKQVDVVSWDNYPRYDAKPSRAAMCNDLYRGVGGGKPFMLMEQTPSQQNWQPYNVQKRPGQMRSMSYQSIAHGADTIQFFQLRQSVSGCERFHGAVISHADREDTRVFREVSELGKELGEHGKEFLGGHTKAQVAIMFDWNSYWSMYYSSGPSRLLEYTDQVHRYYAALWRRNIQVDIIPSDTSADQLAKYRAVLAPAMVVTPKSVSQAVTDYVRQGGRFVATSMSGVADENDKVILGGYPGAFRDLVGAWGEEIDALTPGHDVEVVLQGNSLGQAGSSVGKDGKSELDAAGNAVGSDAGRVSASIIAEIVHPVTASVLASYGSEYYKGEAAVTVNSFGEGNAYYVGTVLDDEGFDWFVGLLADDAGIRAIDSPKDVEICQRFYGGDDSGASDSQNATGYALTFVINDGPDSSQLILPGDLCGTNVLTGEEIKGQMAIGPYGVYVIRRQLQQ